MHSIHCHHSFIHSFIRSIDQSSSNAHIHTNVTQPQWVLMRLINNEGGEKTSIPLIFIFFSAAIWFRHEVLQSTTCSLSSQHKHWHEIEKRSRGESATTSISYLIDPRSLHPRDPKQRQHTALSVTALQSSESNQINRVSHILSILHISVSYNCNDCHSVASFFSPHSIETPVTIIQRKLR